MLMKVSSLEMLNLVCIVVRIFLCLCGSVGSIPSLAGELPYAMGMAKKKKKKGKERNAKLKVTLWYPSENTYQMIENDEWINFFLLNILLKYGDL